MIRREVHFADASPQWLLISQVEHARLSGELAEKCLNKFGSSDSLDNIRQELLQGIVHHDDGWSEWEAEPRLDPASGRPLSFMEVALEEAIAIWDRSIFSARDFGELAGWAVAGHFSALLATAGSDHAKKPAGRDWLRDVADRRSQWFADWHSRNESLHTAELAGEALKWVQLFDLLSLWPCAQYPVMGERVTNQPGSFRTAKDWVLVREIRPGIPQIEKGPGRIVFDPWPFQERELTLRANAHLVPVRRYQDPAELMAARELFVAEWAIEGNG